MINSFVELVREIYQTKEFIPLHAPVFSSIDKEMVVDAIGPVVAWCCWHVWVDV